MNGPPTSGTVDPPAPLAPDARKHWLLDPDIAFLNHGSFGAVPREVLDVQASWRDRIERRPVEMLDRRMGELMIPSHEAVGLFLNAAPDEVAFMTNATGCINAVLRSMRFSPGDRIVTTNHVYNAVRKTMQWVAARDGAEYVEIEVDLPVDSGDMLANRLIEGIPDKTRLLLIDDVSSATGVRFPVERVLEHATSRGIETIIDGAHAPGMIDVDLNRLMDLGAVAWTGNLHKWCFAPKGCAVLHVCHDIRERIQPTTISHFAEEAFHEKFKWQGTCDMTPWLSVPAALAFAEEQFGWDRLRRHNHALATWAHQMLCDRWDVDPLTPLDGSLLGSMAAMALPDVLRSRYDSTDHLQARLYDEFKVEAPINDWSGMWVIRASCQAYNTPDEYERLADAVVQLAR